MSALSDETLLAYADGTLDGETAAEVAQQLEGDADARARLAGIEAGGRLARDAFAEDLQDPVPDRFAALLLGDAPETGPAENPAPPEDPAASATLLSFPTETKTKARPVWQLALAASIALAVGLAGGLSGSGLLEGGDRSNLLAAGPVGQDSLLHSALQSNASYQDAVDKGSRITPMLSFRDSQGHFCREYQVVEGERGAAGLACLQDGTWVATAVVAFPEVTPGTFATASGPAADLLSALLAEEMTDGPLDPDAEAAAIAKGWRP
ncbi:MAG: hypothetical protein Kilf2KO_26940 [Rhodospirillales bacterium]